MNGVDHFYFTTKSGSLYFVSFYGKQTKEITFGLQGSVLDLTNKGEAFEVLRLVSETILNYIKNNPYNQYKFYGIEEGGKFPMNRVIYLLLRNHIIYYLVSECGIVIDKIRQHFIRPTKRTAIFMRWLKEIPDGWESKLVGNVIYLNKI